MNTRLQVEHPVTELITGLDLVELMIRISYGEKIPFKQNEVNFIGWAIEARIYAEDSSRNFLPSIGRLTRYIEPEGKNIRIDSGVIEGSEISMYYDPMISKLCVFSQNRVLAIQKMIDVFFIKEYYHVFSKDLLVSYFLTFLMNDKSFFLLY